MDDNELVVVVEQELKFDAPLPVLDNPDHFPWVLTEDDIPGASLQGKLPHLLKVPELQFWLRCHGISVAGLNKSQLVSTVQNILPVQTKLSGTCGHVSAVLHQLIEWSQRYKQKDNSLRCEKKIDIDDNTPCTSKQNTWKPHKKKSLLPKSCIADYTFHKIYMGETANKTQTKAGLQNIQFRPFIN
ncbi:unnamed protein product [Mytilus edulis]|uniref:SAP domain-containing protein n=1 Tax=Mytilus edulis TaxID=6550 RepID=A0A8S3UIT5_MYTED|nr:unnamed protein product [Mytilus edulis]